MDIQLTDEDKAFIDERVRAGTYRSAAAVVEAGLRSLRELEAEQAELRALIRAGDEDLAAGRYTEYESAEALAESIIARGRALVGYEASRYPADGARTR